MITARYIIILWKTWYPWHGEGVADIFSTYTKQRQHMCTLELIRRVPFLVLFSCGKDYSLLNQRSFKFNV